MGSRGLLLVCPLRLSVGLCGGVLAVGGMSIPSHRFGALWGFLWALRGCPGFGVSCCVALWLALVSSVGSDPLAGTVVPVERSGAVRARKSRPRGAAEQAKENPGSDPGAVSIYSFLISPQSIRRRK